jgi:hypothetical protein
MEALLFRSRLILSTTRETTSRRLGLHTHVAVCNLKGNVQRVSAVGIVGNRAMIIGCSRGAKIEPRASLVSINVTRILLAMRMGREFHVRSTELNKTQHPVNRYVCDRDRPKSGWTRLFGELHISERPLSKGELEGPPHEIRGEQARGRRAMANARTMMIICSQDYLNHPSLRRRRETTKSITQLRMGRPSRRNKLLREDRRRNDECEGADLERDRWQIRHRHLIFIRENETGDTHIVRGRTPGP